MSLVSVRPIAQNAAVVVVYWNWFKNRLKINFAKAIKFVPVYIPRASRFKGSQLRIFLVVHIERGAYL